MSWVTVIWSMIASACLTLAAILLMIWLKKRTVWANLALSLLAVGTAAMTAGELWLMRSETAGQYATIVRLLHIPYWVVIVSLVFFVLLRLRAGRVWLAWTICILRTISLILNFLVGQNLNFREIIALKPIRFLGESVSIAEGVSNPWMLVGQLALVLLLVFIADAAVSAWRRGNGQLALIMGSSMLFFVLGATVLSVLIFWLIIPVPVMHSIFYVGVVGVMGYEITRDALRSGQLADDLRQSEVRYRNIFEESIVGIFRTSPEGKALAANAAMAKILGYDSAENLVQSITDIGTQVWLSQEERFRLLRRVEEEGPIRAYECKFKRKDGAIIWVSLSIRPVRRPDGLTAYYEGFVEDINEHKKAELALAESEERYRTLFEMTPAGIIVVDTEGYVLAANSNQARLYGYASPRELEGFYSPFFLVERERERAFEEMTALLQGSDQAERAYTAVRRDGSEFTVSVTFAILQGPNQEVQGYLCMSRDITRAQQEENERAQLRLERTHLARVLTVNELSTSLAHEINQPLGAILNNAEAARILLSQARDNREAIPEIVDEIIQDTRRAGDVVRKVRSILKKGDIQFESLHVNALIDQTLEILHNNFVLNNVALQRELMPDLPDIRGDRIRLQQVLMNLMINAMDAMKEVPLRILTVRSAMDGPGMVTVSVGDSGPGIVEDKRETVFEPFFTTKKDGLGLGLPICRSIIEEHGGRIWANNNLGGGATFSFSLKVWREGSP